MAGSSPAPRPHTTHRTSPATDGARARRHLLYHVWPVRGSLWRWNVRHLLARLDVFNGRRLIAIVHDERSEPPEAVQRLLDGHGCEFVVRRNHPLAEARTFPLLLERLSSEQPLDVAFYAHAKGVKYGAQAPPAVRWWARAQYMTCLDDWLTVREHLATAALTGPFRRVGRFRAHQGVGDWHYSGTFFWMRLDRALAPLPRVVPRFYGGVEAWPGVHFRRHEARCLFFDHVDASLYDPRFWHARGLPALAAWRARVRRVRPPVDLLHPVPVDGTRGPRTEQKPDELRWWIGELLRAGVRRLLVIGSSEGGVEWHAARMFRAHGRDLALTSVDRTVSAGLRRAADEMRRDFGQEAHVVEGDPTLPQVRAQLDRAYDAVFVDADHGYHAARRHWLLARDVSARLVAFHDIVDSDWHVQNRCCVSRLWREVRASHPSAQRASGEWGGIGVVRLH